MIRLLDLACAWCNRLFPLYQIDSPNKSCANKNNVTQPNRMTENESWRTVVFGSHARDNVVKHIQKICPQIADELFECV